MTRTRVLVQLPRTLVAALDERVAKRGISRSQFIREAVEAQLAAEQEAEISRRILEGYRQVPQDTPDEWGDPQAWAGAAARHLHRRLDAEEREQGRSPR